MNDDEDDARERLERLGPEGRRALLGDLESIRTALLETEPDEASIPVLRDVVPPDAGREADGDDDAPGPSADEDARLARAETEAGELFDARAFADALLDDVWRAERDAIVAEARAGARAMRAGLHGETSGLDDGVLRARLVEVLQLRAEQVVGEAMEHLQRQLTKVIRREIAATIDEALTPEPHRQARRTD